jgi:prepilin signal peptidase PulO-like enzyme (type II secretory pathway)
MITIAAFVFGLLIGSFLNVLIWRLPRDESIGGRSHCPHCNHTLTARDLVPLLSFTLARGRCRYCKKPVSYRYPLIETITGFLFAAAAMVFLGHTNFDAISILKFIEALVVIAICITVFVIDLEHYLILDRIVFTGYALVGIITILLAVLSHSPLLIFMHILVAVLAAIPFWLLWYSSKGKWMGFGDVKFVALMGLILGGQGIIIALFLAFMIGALFGVILILAGKKQFGSKLPFGTFLTIATILALFFAPQIWNWYWSLIGLS